MHVILGGDELPSKVILPSVRGQTTSNTDYSITDEYV